ncbi:interferon alpha/beta receptor 1a isoform X2 [Pangasianodon hypophthalmus]|uniref:interferon alpha/beta receptor 1a isoform X2 n=1 Tax=Pangasianodon hypophthalmus TaxID=310915 RepID=UPI000EFF9C24|nr:interferon alpha/beta receptor 1a isoform X2 [Pangasianodon hypophthalmus]
MSLHLDLRLTLLLIMTVSASLPGPHDVKMIAVDMDYMLQWEWNYTQLEDPVTFTSDYVFWEAQDDEGSYKRACKGSRERQCDFTHCKLPFSGTFLIRVRAEAGLQCSNWTQMRFTPDEDVLLASPSRVNVKADVDGLTLMISKSVMRDVMKLQYRVQYWERLKPEQKHVEVYDSPHAPLSSLKSWTEYCVQVSVFSLDYEKSSNYTSPQCVYTTGRPLVWLRILSVLCSIPVLGAFLYICHKFRRKSSVYTAPESILGFPSVPLLLDAQEECCTVALVITPAIQPTHTLKEEQEQEHTPELQAPESICHWSDGSVQDSGFSSGRASGSDIKSSSECLNI